MNNSSTDAINRAEEISATCDDMMINQPRNRADVMAAREGLKEAVTELEALQGTLPDNRYPCVGTSRKLPKRSLLRTKLEREFKK